MILLDRTLNVKGEVTCPFMRTITEQREVNVTEDIANLALALGILATSRVEAKIREEDKKRGLPLS